VADHDGASILIADYADEHGGYFVTRSHAFVELRLPNERLGRFRLFIAEIADEITRFDPSSRDLRTQLIRVDAGITSRTEALEKILTYLTQADIGATLAFEQELRALNGELDSLKGQERRILHDIEYSSVSVSLSSSTSEIPAHLPSSFDWINRVDLYRFISEASW
jgi:hypothetical protein